MVTYFVQILQKQTGLLARNLRVYRTRQRTRRKVESGKQRTNNFLNAKQRFFVDASTPVHDNNETRKRVDAEPSRQSGLLLGVRRGQAKSQRFQLVDQSSPSRLRLQTHEAPVGVK